MFLWLKTWGAHSPSGLFWRRVIKGAVARFCSFKRFRGLGKGFEGILTTLLISEKKKELIGRPNFSILGPGTDSIVIVV